MAAESPTVVRAALTLLAFGVWFALGAAEGANTAVEQSAKPCRLKLAVRFSPEVPNPRDPAFLSSLEGRPGFRLVWEGGSKANMSQTLELIGPGPGYRCMRELERMRSDARVIDIRVVGH